MDKSKALSAVALWLNVRYKKGAIKAPYILSGKKGLFSAFDNTSEFFNN